MVVTDPVQSDMAGTAPFHQGALRSVRFSHPANISPQPDELGPPEPLELRLLFIIGDQLPLERFGVRKETAQVVTAGLLLGQMFVSKRPGGPVPIDQLPVDLK